MTTFDPGPWPDETSTDRIHVQWIAETLMSGRFARVLEIGCHTGYSTQAFLHALKAGKIEHLHLCDPNMRSEVIHKVHETTGEITWHKRLSVDVLARGSFDLVFVDGDHSKENVLQESRLLLQRKTPAVFCHDTAAIGLLAHTNYDCSGPCVLRALFLHADYHCMEDVKKRPGQLTERGMFFAGITPDLLEIAKCAAERVGM